MKRLLTVDADKRITVDEALQHPWISVSTNLSLRRQNRLAVKCSYGTLNTYSPVFSSLPHLEVSSSQN